MPSRNSRKTFASHSFYHVYNRGVEKRVIFLEDADYTYFLFLLKRHLSEDDIKDKKGRTYTKYYDVITLTAFCLMPNHFHLLFYQHDDPTAITKLMSSVCTAYTMYFNKKYKRVGHLFQERFKASHIHEDSYLQHISRYIHLNPESYETYAWSSLPYYLGNLNADWVKPQKIMEVFDNNKSSYLTFVKDYEDQKFMLDELKYSLADL